MNGIQIKTRRLVAVCLLAFAVPLILPGSVVRSGAHIDAGRAHAALILPASPTMSIEVVNIVSGSVDSLSGFGTANEVVQLRAVDLSGKEVISKVPGGVKRGAFRVVRKVTSDMDLWSWRALVDKDLAAARRSGKLIYRDADGKQVAEWHFTRAWPSRYELTFDGDVIYESVWITCDDISRVM